MKKSILQQLAPHALAVSIFLAVACIYCMPALKGMVVNQHDTRGWKGGAQQSFEYKEKHGRFPLWTNSTFSGMPTYQIAVGSKYNITIAWASYLFTFFLPSPAGYFFLSCICFYILCITLGLRPWPSIFGSLGYAFASFNAVIVAVGHIPEFASMGYAPAVIAGVILLTQRKYFLGFATTLLFTTIMAYQNHIQIVYYTFITLGCIGVSFAIRAIREKQVKHLLTAAVLAAVALGIGLASFAVILLPLNEYAKETMRGGRSELTVNQSTGNKTKGGLDKDYAFTWSYGLNEPMAFMLPTFKGGSNSAGELGEENNSIQALQEAQLPQQAVDYFYKYTLSPYWGTQYSTAGPVYFGAIVCMLFVAGLFVVRSWHKGWIIAATIIGIVLAWGSNFSAVNYFIFDHLPYYNKFRAPTMSLVMPQLTFALLAAMALNEICYGNLEKTVLLKRLKNAGIAVAVLALLLTFNYFSADFKAKNDGQTREYISGTIIRLSGAQQKAPSDQVMQQANTIAAQTMGGLVKDRRALYGSDLVRMFIFLALGALIIWLLVEKKIKALYALIALAAISFTDLIQVDLRYLKSGNYIDEDEFLQAYTANAADTRIRQDTGYYRVFDETAEDGPFQSSRASYFHNSVGGYHPAKLALYDDLIKLQLSKYNMRVFDMLNTKYFITADQASGQPTARPNSDANGPVWLVKSLKYANNADEEMKALDSLNTRDTAIIDKREQVKIPFAPQPDSAASIRLVQHENEHLTYQSEAATNQFAVFSEIYYPYGWTATIDGKEAPIARVDYVLRGLAIPAGKHTIDFRFEPSSFAKGDLISLILGIISILVVLALIAYEWQRYRKNKPIA